MNWYKNTWPWICYLGPPGQVAPATVWVLPSPGPKPVIPVIPNPSEGIHIRELSAGKGIPGVKLDWGCGWVIWHWFCVTAWECVWISAPPAFFRCLLSFWECCFRLKTQKWAGSHKIPPSFSVPSFSNVVKWFLALKQPFISNVWSASCHYYKNKWCEIFDLSELGHYHQVWNIFCFYPFSGKSKEESEVGAFQSTYAARTVNFNLMPTC